MSNPPFFVRQTALVSSTPWQRASSTLLRKWLDSDLPPELTYNFLAHLAPPPAPEPPIGPGFDFPLGESTDDENDDDDVID